MKSGFRRTLEMIVLGGVVVASLVGVSSAVSCNPKPEPTPIVIAVADPWSVSADGTKAYLGYGADGKPVPFDVDGFGDKLFSFFPSYESTYKGSFLKIDEYRILNATEGMFSFALFFKESSQAASNFGIVGVAQNTGKSYTDMAIVKNYKNLGDIVITAWKANSPSDKNKTSPENDPILNAIAKALGYDFYGDHGQDQPLIVIGPGLDVQTPGNEPRGKNTTYGAKVTVYRLNPQGAKPYNTQNITIPMLEKIASQPPTLNPKYARNQLIEGMEVVNEGGNLTIKLRVTYEANDGKRYEIPQPSKASLDSLISSGMAQEGKVTPLLK